jgi:hypothetical protein
MDKHQSKIIILVSLLISVIIIFFALRSKPQPLSGSIPPPVPIAQASQLATVGSPDGKFVLAMEQEKGKDAITYTFLMTNKSDDSQKKVFSKTEMVGIALSIPSNTFSSDDKYIFLKETSGTQINYLVLSGDPIDVSSLFVAKYQNYVITDATGWAGPTLLIINTDKTGGGTGPTFWFDVASSSFIQLSTRFN